MKQSVKFNFKPHHDLVVNNEKMIIDLSIKLGLTASYVDPHAYSKQFLKIMNNSGLKSAISYMKISRMIVYRYASGDPLRDKQGVKVTSDGIPVFLQQ